MRAISIPSFGGPEALTLTEVATPEPAPGQVRIQVAAAGVNRADTLQRLGFYPPPPGESELPGLEVSGTVQAIGEGVTNWGTLMAAATVIATPPIVLTFLIQRRLVSGLSFGAVKG